MRSSARALQQPITLRHTSARVLRREASKDEWAVLRTGRPTRPYHRPLVLGGFEPERTRRRARESDRSVGISLTSRNFQLTRTYCTLRSIEVQVEKTDL